ncbi:MAG: DNA repair protein RecO [Proteobacteria bacterium]|nr:DNA repair protein RecO [Pseudomonadota bacterium]
MDWTDDGIVLSARRHGENALVVTLLTKEHGRHAGLVRGGASARNRGLYQPGNRLAVSWRARLSEHLGNFSCELQRSWAARLLQAPLPLLALSAATAMLDSALPERAPVPGLFESVEELIASLDNPGWQIGYIRWELALLTELGFGLDLSACAATGEVEELVYVSPKSGRAVSAAAGGIYRDKLLALPGFLLAQEADVAPKDICDGLKLTGYFLAKYVLGDTRDGLPAARQRLAEGFMKAMA